MLDPVMTRLLGEPVNRIGRAAARMGLPANLVTVAGFFAGITAVPAIGTGRYDLALALFALNRAADGLDGAIARATATTDFGAYLDIVLDFIVYAALVFGFAWAEPSNALAATALAVSFMGTGASFLAFAVLAAKRGLDTETRGRKSFFYSGGLAEGTETIVFFVFVCLWPAAFVQAAIVFAAMCWITVAMRIFQAWHMFQK